jgi:hypothetical protein
LTREGCIDRRPGSAALGGQPSMRGARVRRRSLAATGTDPTKTNGAPEGAP